MTSQSNPSNNAVLTPLGIGLALSLLGDATLYAVLPSANIAAQAGVSLAMVGLLLGANRLVRIVFNSSAGWLFDRLPRRPLMLISLAIGTLSTIFYAAGSGPWIMLLGRIFWGMAWSGLWIGANTMALDISNNNNRGMVNGRLQMWFYIGVATSSFAGGFFTDLFSYRGGLWLSTILSAIGWLIWLKYLPETRATVVIKPAPTDAKPEPGEPFPWRLTASSAVPYFVMRIIYAGVLSSTTILWLSQFVKNGRFSFNGFALPLATLTGAMIALRVLVSVFSAPQVGRISDYFGRRWLILAIVTMTFGAGGLYLLSMPIFAVSIIGALLSSIASGSIPAIIPAIIGDRIPQQLQSRTLGLIFTAGDLGSAIGPPLALGLFPVIGLQNLFLGCALLYGVTALFLGGLAWGEHNHIQTSAVNIPSKPDIFL